VPEFQVGDIVEGKLTGRMYRVLSLNTDTHTMSTEWLDGSGFTSSDQYTRNYKLYRRGKPKPKGYAKWIKEVESRV
jgi:hypothetical protein